MAVQPALPMRAEPDRAGLQQGQAEVQDAAGREPSPRQAAEHTHTDHAVGEVPLEGGNRELHRARRQATGGVSPQ